MIVRLIAPKWAKDHLKPDALEADLSFDQILDYNSKGYNVYFFPNYPSPEAYETIPVNEYGRKRPIAAQDVDTFEYVFADMDLKDYKSTDPNRTHNYATKDDFILALADFPLQPTRIIDSGNGIHTYWKVTGMDAMSFLRLARRLKRALHTDPAVQKLNQLMRLPNTVNTKDEHDWKVAQILFENEENVYDIAQMDAALPPIRVEDEEYCKQHYDMAQGVDSSPIPDELPVKFLHLISKNPEAKSLFYDYHKDRSTADFRLGHLLFAAGLNQEEALTVLANTSKASERTPQHRRAYAQNIVTKVWAFEKKTETPSEFKILSKTVADLLGPEADQVDENTRFPCHPIIDSTEHGFRLSEVLGLVSGSGNGKSTLSLNVFKWFIERNPEYFHLYVTLEQPVKEVTARWKKLCAGDATLHDKVHILGNYNDDGTYRHLGLADIEAYAKGLEKHLGKKLGCLVIDHIGVLKKSKTNSDYGGLKQVMEGQKAVAVSLNCFLIMQSQSSRSKAGIGDKELDLDAAYGGSEYEHYCDYVFTMHQPLKRIYRQAPDMTVIAFKKCKDRHKNQLVDKMLCDVLYCLKFEPETGALREMTSDEHKRYDFWNRAASQLRNRDRDKEPSEVTQITWTQGQSGGSK